MSDPVKFDGAEMLGLRASGGMAWPDDCRAAGIEMLGSLNKLSSMEMQMSVLLNVVALMVMVVAEDDPRECAELAGGFAEQVMTSCLHDIANGHGRGKADH